LLRDKSGKPAFLSMQHRIFRLEKFHETKQ
jgi:hypothetical protein